MAVTEQIGQSDHLTSDCTDDQRPQADRLLPGEFHLEQRQLVR